jgi:holo-[acyl-carrier protein] synthase
MSRGIGIDAVEIERIRGARKRLGAAFEARILSEAERSLLSDTLAPDLFLAGRFAAKEAVMKVLGTGWARGVRFEDIEVLKDSAGVPVVHLTRAAAATARSLGIRQVLVSITHTRDLAMAVAVGEGADL